jgi:hypothetical protein
MQSAFSGIFSLENLGFRSILSLNSAGYFRSLDNLDNFNFNLITIVVNIIIIDVIIIANKVIIIL